MVVLPVAVHSGRIVDEVVVVVAVVVLLVMVVVVMVSRGDILYTDTSSGVVFVC